MTGVRRIGILAGAAAVILVVLWRLHGGTAPPPESDGPVTVHVDTVRRATLRRFVTAYGTVAPSPALDGAPAAGALVTAVRDGVVAGVEAVEGRPVRAGESLVRLDDRVARQSLARAAAEADFAEEAFRRQEQLLDADGTSQRDYLDALRRRDAARAELATARTELDYMDATAPLDGVVTGVDARPGQRVSAGTVLARVVDPDRLVVEAAVPAAEMDGVAVGRPARLGASADRVDGEDGEVVAVGRDVDGATGTVRVLISIPPGSDFVPGAFTEVHIETETREDVPVVPLTSLVTRGGGSWVVVVTGDRATRRAVTPGLREGDRVEVVGDGLVEGTVVVTEEAYSLPEEIRVRRSGT